MISYAQNGEDIILWRALRHVENGFYIDVGACDPTQLSVTRLFYERGWNGINVEPSREYYDRCVAERPRDVNLNIAVAERAGMVRFLNVAGTGLSTLSDENAASAAQRGFAVEERTVSAMPLTSVSGIASGREVHFLKVDVEGGERAVLAGGDFRQFRPWIVVVEAVRPNSAERNDGDWRDILLRADYEQAYFDGINLYFLAAEHRDLLDRLAIQPNVLDDYRPVAAADMERRIAELDQAVTEREATLRAATAHGASVEAALARVREQHDAMAAELRRSVEAAQQEARARRDVQARLGRERQEREREQALLAQLRDQSSQLSGQLEHVTAARNQLEAAVHALLPAGQPGATPALRLEAAWALRAEDLAAAEAQVVLLREQQRQLLASTSWRITAPLRGTRHLLRPEGGADPAGKALARRVFRLGMRALLAVPGARGGARLVQGLAPRPVAWLALRYRAYGGQGPAIAGIALAAEGPAEIPPPIGPDTVPDAAPPPSATGDAEMSGGEARVLRQLAAGGPAASTTGQGGLACV